MSEQVGRFTTREQVAAAAVAIAAAVRRQQQQQQQQQQGAGVAPPVAVPAAAPAAAVTPTGLLYMGDTFQFEASGIKVARVAPGVLPGKASRVSVMATSLTRIDTLLIHLRH